MFEVLGGSERIDVLSPERGDCIGCTWGSQVFSYCEVYCS